MKTFATFYTEHGPAVGSDSVLQLDGRLSQFNQRRIAERKGRQRGFTAFTICRGNTYSNPISESKHFPIISALQVLKEARALIEDPKHWTTGVEARDKNGNAVPVFNPEACQFCALGAVNRAASVHPGQILDAITALLTTVSNIFPGYDGTPDVNDQLGHAAVLTLFDETIRRLES